MLIPQYAAFQETDKDKNGGTIYVINILFVLCSAVKM